MSPRIDRPDSTSSSTVARQSSLRPHGVNTSAVVQVKGSEPDRPVTLFHRDGWAWICPVCATSESGFDLEHHARTIADQHLATHRPDLAGASTTPTPPAPTAPDTSALRRRQAQARAVLAAAVKESP